MEHTEISSGVFVSHHDKGKCAGQVCPFHAPTDHVMRGFSMHWRSDRGLLERICPHGVGHPDPDDLTAKKVVFGDNYKKYAFGVHGCDGCCIEGITL